MKKLIAPKKLVAVIILLISVFLSMFVLYTPKPIQEEQRFSSIRALVHIKEISREPHSVIDPVAHENVRLYIKNTLTSYIGSANVFEKNSTTSASTSIEWKDWLNETFGKSAPSEIKNVLGVFPGKSDTAIMLVGHYDSAAMSQNEGLGRSSGAADDGYALGTMLEIANLFKGRQLENTIYLLFTDGEDIGLAGATRAVLDKDLMAKVGFVINMKAFGVSGPVYMFETSPKNKKIIDFYRKANLPVSYSLATTVYQEKHLYTDFSRFLDVTKSNGINFAAIAGADHMYTSGDNYQTVSASTLQHYGEQITPLVEAFVNDPKYSDVHYFDANEDSVFFTLFPKVFVNYSETVAKILNFAVLALLIAIALFMVKKRGVVLREIPKFAVGILVVLIVAIGVAFGYGYLMALVGKVSYSMTYMFVKGSEWPSLLFMLALAAAVFLVYRRKADTIEKQRTFLLFGVSLQLLLALATGFLVPGASFLFFIPALLGTLALAASMQNGVIVKHAVYGATILVSTLLIVPILYSFFLTLNVGGTPIFVALLMINLTVSLPVFKLQVDV